MAPRPAGGADGKEKEKKRALPSEFERQVEQIRADMKTVRANLDAAERVLRDSESRAGGGAGPSSAPLGVPGPSQPTSQHQVPPYGIPHGVPATEADVSLRDSLLAAGPQDVMGSGLLPPDLRGPPGPRNGMQ